MFSSSGATTIDHQYISAAETGHLKLGRVWARTTTFTRNFVLVATAKHRQPVIRQTHQACLYQVAKIP